MAKEEKFEEKLTELEKMVKKKILKWSRII